MTYLPGNTWPEKWIITILQTLDTKELADIFKCSEEELNIYIEEALTAEKHNEIYSLCKSLSLEVENVKATVASWLTSKIEKEFAALIFKIKEHLD